MGSNVFFRPSSHKTSDITRLAKINHTFRFLTRGRTGRQKKNGASKRHHDTDTTSPLSQHARDGSMQGLLWHGRETDNHRRLGGDESPIASLRHLHDKHRLGVDESIVISEDESAIHELTDEDDDVDDVKTKTTPTTLPVQPDKPDIPLTPSCPPEHITRAPPVIQISGPDQEKMTSSTVSPDIIHNSTVSSDRKYSLPVALESSPNIRRKIHNREKDTLSKSQTHCNGVTPKSRAGNIESAKWKAIQCSNNVQEPNAVLQLSNNTSVKPEYQELSEEGLMWL